MHTEDLFPLLVFLVHKWVHATRSAQSEIQLEAFFFFGKLQEKQVLSAPLDTNEELYILKSVDAYVWSTESDVAKNNFLQGENGGKK